MHILYFHQYFSTPQGSTGTRSYEFAKKLITKGHQVTMICMSHEHSGFILPYNVNEKCFCGEIDGINVIQFDIPYSNHYNLRKRAKIFLRFAYKSVVVAFRKDYDILFASSTPLTAGIPGIFASVLRRKKFIFEVRDLWPELPKAMGVIKNPFILAGMSILEWLSYKTATACIALSPGICEGIVKKSKKKPITIIPNGCDLDIFNPEYKENIDLPGVSLNDFIAVFTGAHGIANGLDSVLDAAKILIEKNRDDIKIIFIGDGKLKPALLNRAKEEGLVNCLFFDPIPKNELSKIVSSANVGLMILANVPEFYYGTSPNKFFDYISAGIPVLNNYPGWLAELINENKCGIVAKPGNPVDFANCLCELADNKDKNQIYGTNSRRLAEKSFNRDILSDRFLDLIEKVGLGQVESGIQHF